MFENGDVDELCEANDDEEDSDEEVDANELPCVPDGIDKSVGLLLLLLLLFSVSVCLIKLEHWLLLFSSLIWQSTARSELWRGVFESSPLDCTWRFGGRPGLELFSYKNFIIIIIIIIKWMAKIKLNIHFNLPITWKIIVSQCSYFIRHFFLLSFFSTSFVV